MFDRAIIDTDRFMDLPMSAKALYFLLGMEADDEGFVSYKKVIRIHGGNEDDIKILIAKSFIIKFDTGVVVITDWNTNNYLDKNRTRPTEYQKEKRLLLLTGNNKYEFNSRSTSIEEYRREEKSIEENNTTSVSQETDGIKVEEPIYPKDFEDFYKEYPLKVGKGAAHTAWKRVKNVPDKSILKKAIIEHIKNNHFRGSNGMQYIPHPSTWINQRRWEDEIKSNQVKSYEFKE